MSKKSTAFQYAKAIIKNEIPSGDHLLKALIGKTKSSPIKSLLSGPMNPLSTQPYCVALTNNHLLLIKLDALFKPVEVEQVKFSEIIWASFKTGLLNDDLSLSFGEDRQLLLDVFNSYRDQGEAIALTIQSVSPTVNRGDLNNAGQTFAK